MCTRWQNQSKSPGQMASYSTITSKSQDWRPYILILSRARISASFLGFEQELHPRHHRPATTRLHGRSESHKKSGGQGTPMSASSIPGSLLGSSIFGVGLWTWINFCLQSQLSEHFLPQEVLGVVLIFREEPQNARNMKAHVLQRCFDGRKQLTTSVTCILPRPHLLAQDVRKTALISGIPYIPTKTLIHWLYKTIIVWCCAAFCIDFRHSCRNAQALSGSHSASTTLALGWQWQVCSLHFQTISSATKVFKSPVRDAHLTYLLSLNTFRRTRKVLKIHSKLEWDGRRWKCLIKNPDLRAHPNRRPFKAFFAFELPWPSPPSFNGRFQLISVHIPPLCWQTQWRHSQSQACWGPQGQMHPELSEIPSQLLQCGAE